jgi:hypothetical protein
MVSKRLSIVIVVIVMVILALVILSFNSLFLHIQASQKVQASGFPSVPLSAVV